MHYLPRPVSEAYLKLMQRPVESAQFTADELTVAILKHSCKLWMDGKGAWRNNVFVERLWRSVKYERVYWMACDSVSAARAYIANKRRHFYLA